MGEEGIERVSVAADAPKCNWALLTLGLIRNDEKKESDIMWPEVTYYYILGFSQLEEMAFFDQRLQGM